MTRSRHITQPNVPIFQMPGELTLQANDAVSELKTGLIEIEALLRAAVAAADFRPGADRNAHRTLALLHVAYTAAEGALRDAERRSTYLQREFRRRRRARITTTRTHGGSTGKK